MSKKYYEEQSNSNAKDLLNNINEESTDKEINDFIAYHFNRLKNSDNPYLREESIYHLLFLTEKTKNKRGVIEKIMPYIKDRLLNDRHFYVRQAALDMIQNFDFDLLVSLQPTIEYVIENDKSKKVQNFAVIIHTNLSLKIEKENKRLEMLLYDKVLTKRGN
ncbi:MAG TPA: hypothetical protein VMZ91_05865 [Candidatus Paceibacterota bacterium]|nr:hypothetical protein [Candidatus Paceibacterota bacterium]